MKKLITDFKYEFLILVLFITSRLPNLGHDLFNTDVWKWKARIYDFGSGVFGLDFIKTIQKYHPGITLMWIGSIGVKIHNFYYETILKISPPDNDVRVIFGLHFIQKLCIVVVIGLVLVSVYRVLNKLFGKKYAFLATALVSLEPFYVALTRVVHLEGLMTSFMLASYVWFYYFLTDTTQRKRLYISGIFTGLAILTKTSSLFLLPFMGLMAFLWYWIPSKSFKSSLKSSFSIYGKWILAAIITFIVVWPAMWTNPLLAIGTLYKGIFTVGVEGGHEQFYFLKYTLDPGPLYYFVVFGLRSSVTVVAGLIGYLFVSKKLSVEKKKFAFYTFLFAILYLVFLTIPSKKLDRYIIPSMTGLIFIAAFFYEYVFTQVRSRFRVVGIALLGLIVIFPLVTVHPDYFSYYNPLFGGLHTGIRVLEPKWMIGGREVSNYFSKVRAEHGYESFTYEDSFDSMVNTDAK